MANYAAFLGLWHIRQVDTFVDAAAQPTVMYPNALQCYATTHWPISLTMGA
jgi:hypothetical protein